MSAVSAGAWLLSGVVMASSAVPARVTQALSVARTEVAEIADRADSAASGLRDLAPSVSDSLRVGAAIIRVGCLAARALAPPS